MAISNPIIGPAKTPTMHMQPAATSQNKASFMPRNLARHRLAWQAS